MPISLQSVDAVVVGRFNPYIITPPWLDKEDVVKAENAMMAFGFETEGSRPVTTVTVGDFKLMVTDTRLRISSDSPDKNPSEIAAKVLGILRHTPVSAVGHNFHYRCEAVQWSGRLPRIGEHDREGLKLFGDPRELSWSCVLQQAGLITRMEVKQRESSVEVHTNLHREASEADQVMAICGEFAGDLELSNKLVSSVLGDEVTR